MVLGLLMGAAALLCSLVWYAFGRAVEVRSQARRFAILIYIRQEKRDLADYRSAGLGSTMRLLRDLALLEDEGLIRYEIEEEYIISEMGSITLKHRRYYLTEVGAILAHALDRMREAVSRERVKDAYRSIIFPGS